MSYSIYITRKDNPFSDGALEIEFDEWSEFIQNSNQLSLSEEIQAQGLGGAISISSKGMASFHIQNDPSEVYAYIRYNEGQLVVDTSNEDTIAKLHSLAEALGARVMGEEGEEYDNTGQSNWRQIMEERRKLQQQRLSSAESNVPWWKFLSFN